MRRPRVYIHRAGPWYPLFMTGANQASLGSFADVVSEGARESEIPRAELIRRMDGCSAILSLNGYGSGDITPDVLTAVGSIDLICLSHYWGQFPTVPANTGIPVVEGSNAGTVAVAEWVIGAALMGLRRLHLFDRALKNRSAWGEPRHGAGLLSESTVGLIGLGRIGRYAARYFRALGGRVVASSNSLSPDVAADLGVTPVPLDELLATSDIVSVHKAVADGTRGMLGAREFALIKPGAVFINSARAAVCDEAALVAALKTGRFLAVLDVFAVEPLPASHPFRSMANVVITPHIAGNNSVMFARCAREAIQTLKDYFDGRPPVDRRYAFP